MKNNLNTEHGGLKKLEGVNHVDKGPNNCNGTVIGSDFKHKLTNSTNVSNISLKGFRKQKVRSKIISDDNGIEMDFSDSCCYDIKFNVYFSFSLFLLIINICGLLYYILIFSFPEDFQWALLLHC